MKQARQRHDIDLLRLTGGSLFKTPTLSPNPVGSFRVERTTIGSPTAIPTSEQKGKMLFDDRPSQGTTGLSSPSPAVFNKSPFRVAVADLSQAIEYWTLYHPIALHAPQALSLVLHDMTD
jgi:hypothetical protein